MSRCALGHWCQSPQVPLEDESVCLGTLVSSPQVPLKDEPVRLGTLVSVPTAFEVAGEGAEAIEAVGGESAQTGRFETGRLDGIESVEGFDGIVQQRIEAHAQLDDVGGRPRGGGMLRLAAERLDGGADAGRIFGSEGERLAIDIDGVGGDLRGDLLKGFGRDGGDFGEAEVGVAEALVLVDEVIGVTAADAGVEGAEFVPGEAEVVEHVGVADLLQALGAGGGTAAGDIGEGLLEADPGTEIDLLLRVHEGVSEMRFRFSGEVCCKERRWRGAAGTA